MHAVNEVFFSAGLGVSDEAYRQGETSELGGTVHEWWVPLLWRTQDRETLIYGEDDSLTRHLEEDFGLEPFDLVRRPRRYNEPSNVMTWTSSHRTKSGKIDARFRPSSDDPVLVSVTGKFPYGGSMESKDTNPFWRSGKREARWYSSAEHGPVVVLGTSVRVSEDWPKAFDNFGVWIFGAERERWPDHFPDESGRFKIARTGDGSFVSISQREYEMLLVAFDDLQGEHTMTLEYDMSLPDWD